MEISLCMIVKDEELTLRRCLNSVKDVVDEIIIVDTGSVDSTIMIANEFNSKIYNLKWEDNFAKARNFSFSKATKDYILWLDADDILNSDDIDKFKELKRTLDNNFIDSVTMDYVLSMDENNTPIISLKRNRLVKREKNFKWVGNVHEYLDVEGNIIHSDIKIIHKKEKEYTNRNLKIYENMINENIDFSERDKLYYANELFYNQMYTKAIEVYKDFLELKNIWVEDAKDVCLKLYYCYNVVDDKKSLYYLFKSLSYGNPRSDILYEIGYYFLNKEDFKEAIFWFKSAINNAPEDDLMCLIKHETYTYLPWIQLCVCYSNLNKYYEAFYCNEKAGLYKKDDIYVIKNREFLMSKL